MTPDGKVKVLDFGLAKVFDREQAPDVFNSPTLLTASIPGMILGTAAYMSPEQINGKGIDSRADIWAFGVVLYEMLTRKRLFAGDTTAEILSSVMRDQPSLEAVPATVRPLLERCLEKNPRQRLQAIGEARIALEKPSPVQVRQASDRLRPHWVPWAVTCVLLFIAAGLGVAYWRASRPVEHPFIRLSVDLGPDAVTGFASTVAISSDGNRIAFPVRGPNGRQVLATRQLNQSTPTLLLGTEGARDAFFSPDGAWIGFAADGKLKKISVLGGAAFTLCDAPNARGASWGEDGYIIAALVNNGPLTRVPEAGGGLQALTKLQDGERTHRWPQVLPATAGVLFSSSPGGSWDDANIEAASLKTGERRVVLRGGYFGRYVPHNGSDGDLVYFHKGVLYGVPFDPNKLAITGTPVPLFEDGAPNFGDGGGQLDLSRNGTLVYLSGKSSSGTWPVAWLDSSGKTEPLLSQPGVYSSPRFSPDGNLLAIVMDAGNGNDIYTYDWRHDTMPRLTFNGQLNRDPVWAPDGKHIAYDSRDGLYWIRGDGAGEPRRLLESKDNALAFSFSPDGRRLAFSENADLWTLPLDLTDPENPKPGKPEPFLKTAAAESQGMFSPDGRWIAYTSDETGRQEVFVRPFPGPGGKYQISTGGGHLPVWSRNGRELFYTLEDQILVAPYTAHGEAFSYSKAHLWTNTHIRPVGGRWFFDPAPDGKRLAVFPTEGSGESNVHITFLLNFSDELRRRVQEGR
jgi:serine/threonine-protein kinase